MRANVFIAALLVLRNRCRATGFARQVARVPLTTVSTCKTLFSCVYLVKHCESAVRYCETVPWTWQYHDGGWVDYAAALAAQLTAAQSTGIASLPLSIGGKPYTVHMSGWFSGTQVNDSTRFRREIRGVVPKSYDLRRATVMLSAPSSVAPSHGGAVGVAGTVSSTSSVIGKALASAAASLLGPSPSTVRKSGGGAAAAFVQRDPIVLRCSGGSASASTPATLADLATLTRWTIVSKDE